MHRVELKVKNSSSLKAPFSSVPNAPCGVERTLVLGDNAYGVVGS